MKDLNGVSWEVFDQLLRTNEFFFKYTAFNEFKTVLDCKSNCSKCPFDNNCIVGPESINAAALERYPEYLL